MKRIIFLLLIVLALAACNGNEGAETAAETTTETAVAVDELVVTDVWGRQSPGNAPNGAFYMTIVNGSGSDDELLSAAIDICGTVELHEMYMMENDVMGMREVPGGTIPVANGETVELRPGGLHVMCIGRTADYAPGDTIPITLTFAEAGEMAVTAEIPGDEDTTSSSSDTGMGMGMGNQNHGQGQGMHQGQGQGMGMGQGQGMHQGQGQGMGMGQGQGMHQGQGQGMHQGQGMGMCQGMDGDGNCTCTCECACATATPEGAAETTPEATPEE